MKVERSVRREEIGRAAGDLPIPLDSDPRETCLQGSDSSCEQWQLTDGRKPCSCRDADTAKFDDRRVDSGCRGSRERRVQKFDRSSEIRSHFGSSRCG